MKKRVILFSILANLNVYGQITAPEPKQNPVFLGNESPEALAQKLTGIGKYFSCKFTFSQKINFLGVQKECENSNLLFEDAWSPLNTFVGYKNLNDPQDLKRIYQAVSLRGFQQEKMDELKQKYRAAGINLNMTTQFFNRYIAFPLKVNSKTWKDSPPATTKKYIIGSKYCMGKGSCDTQIGFFKRLQRCNIQETILEDRYDLQGCFQKAIASEWVRKLIPANISNTFNPDHGHNGNEETRETIVWAFLLTELLKRNGH